MIWQFAEYTFDTNNKVLTAPNEDTLLEPKIASLLNYFCQNSDKDINRDQLLETVWHGQIVSDNSINRAILLLRKALGDDDKIKRFIVTVPKVGYRFIVPVKEIQFNESENQLQASGIKKKSSKFKIMPFIYAFMVLVAIGFLIQYFQKLQPENFNPHISPLIRLSEGQSNASMAHDNELFIYTSVNPIDENLNSIFLANNNKSPLVISAPNGNANFGLWANDDSFIVYLYNNETKCEFHLVKIINDIAQKPEVIYQCNNLWYTVFALSADNNKLYFVENESNFGAYQAYELDIKQQNKRLLSQPTLNGIDSFYLNMHPTTGKILLTSDLQPGKSTFYELDVDDNIYKRLKTLDYSVYSAIWSHRPGYVVHPGRHPSYQLIETSLESDKERVLVSDSRRVRNPKRIHVSTNKKQNIIDQNYSFTSYLYNRDILMIDDPQIDLNSTVMDYLPAFSNKADQFAFISKRSSYSQIWIKNNKTDLLKPIEPPDQGRIFYNLAWSFDDQMILANTDSGLILFDVTELSTSETLALPLPAFGVGWYSHNELVYSHYVNNKWQLYVYNIDTKETIRQNEKWSFVLASTTKKVYFDQQYKTYFQGQHMPKFDQCGPFIQRNRILPTLDNDDYYCLAEVTNKENQADLLMWENMTDLSRIENFVNPTEYYTVSNGKKAKTIVSNASSDIMRTNF